MLNSAPDVKKMSWGCILRTFAYHTIFLVEQNPFGWNTSSEGSTRKTDWPQTLLGKSAPIACLQCAQYFK